MPAKSTVQDVDPLALERQVRFALAVANRAVLAVYRPLLKLLGRPPAVSGDARAVGSPAIQSRAVVPKPRQPHTGWARGG
jgi:hypothetical protein